MKAAIVLLLITAITACGQDTTSVTAALTVPDAWAVVAPADDPIGDRPSADLCPPGNYGVENFGGEPSFGVETVDCGYLTVKQPTQAPLQPGDAVAIKIWNFDITVTEPAQGHLAIQLADDLVWETFVPLPASSGLIEAEFLVNNTYPAATDIIYHIDNHGVNSWSLLEITRNPGR